MHNQPILKNTVIEYLRIHPELHTLSARQLARQVVEPRAGYQTWYAARKALELPPVGRVGLKYETKTRKQAVRTPAVLYPNTHQIVIDVPALTVTFHGDGGCRVVTKRDRKALAMSATLALVAGFIPTEYNRGTSIIVLTLKADALEAGIAA